uniref:Non-haem dioxygenase N-terminal domain-containing protein n=1 Tax=Ananas comosus var. bracteatus TaxID=296719 RepID=A0A6V7P8Q3_ANACO|nr:unnamed protein product [Ananas comosus var. bracteatus]
MDPNSGRFEGYGTKLQKDLEGKKDWVDFFFHIVWPPSSVDYSIWPTNPPEYRKANEEYTKYLVKLMDKIFEYLSVGLGLEKHVLKEACGGEELRLLAKINYYPPCPVPT